MTEPAERTRKGWVLALTSAASFMAALDSLVVTTALGTIRNDLGLSMETLQWTVNAYNLSFAVLLLTGAALGDRFGRRPLFLAGILLFVAASAICALSSGATMLIIGRALQGLGAALLMPLGMAILGATFPRDERAKALGILGGITGLALIAGPVIGGAITTGFAWQWIFWINVPIGIAIALLTLIRIPDSRGPKAGLDIVGLVLASCAAFGLVWGLMLGNHAGWSDPEVVTSLFSGAALGAAFIGWEAQTAEPMLPMRLFRARAFAAGISSSFLFYAAMYGVLFFVAQFFQTAQGFSPLGSGLRMVPWTATLFVFAPLGGRLVTKIGERPLVVAGLLLQTLGMAWIAMIAAPDTAYALLVPPMIIGGAGVSLAMPAAQAAVINAVAVTEIGKASGAFNTFRFLGGAFGIAILVAVFDQTGSSASPDGFATGFAHAIGAAALLSAVAATAALAMPGRNRMSVALADSR
ncbi:MAG: MFS transporter [Rhizobiales bacterium]|nr:MFS transporter [Hyphomicrobiales bacterium]